MTGEAGNARHSASTRDLMRAARGGGLKFAGSLAGLVLTFLLQLVLARFLGDSGYGRLRLSILVTELTARLSALGLESPVLRFVPLAMADRDDARLRGILRITFGIPLAVSCAAGLAIWVFADAIAVRLFDDTLQTPALRMMAPAVPLASLIGVLETSSRAFDRVSASVIAGDLVRHATQILLSLALLSAGFALLGAAGAYLLALVLTTAIFLVLLARLLRWRRRRGESVAYPFSVVWRQALPTYLNRLMAEFAGRLESLALGFFGLAAGVGVYGIAFQLSNVVRVFFIALSQVSTPMISELYQQGGVERLAPFYRSITKWGVTVTLPSLLAVALFAEELLWLFGEDFQAGTVAVRILVFGVLSDAATGTCGAILAMTGHARLLAINGAAFLVATIVFDLLLIPDYGVLGAAFAGALSRAVMNLVRVGQVYVLFRILPYNREFVKPLLAAAVTVAVAWLFDSRLTLPHPLLHAAVGMALIGVVYFGAIMALGLSEDDRAILDRIVRRFRPRR